VLITGNTPTTHPSPQKATAPRIVLKSQTTAVIRFRIPEIRNSILSTFNWLLYISISLKRFYQ
jgi:hypothetical protein